MPVQFDLAEIAARGGLKRQITTFAPIEITEALWRDLAAINRKVVEPWQRAKSQIIELYTRELKRRLQSDRVDELTSLFGAIGDEVSRLTINLTPELQQWAFKVEKWHRSRWSNTLLAGTKVDIASLIGPAGAVESIETFMARNAGLIRNIGDEARGKISELVYRGLQERIPARQVGKAISDQLGMSRRRANRIAADQAVKLSSALDAQRQREAGLTVWQWNHSGKLHPRPEHVARDGFLYADEAADRGEAPDGRTIRKPPSDLPGQLPYCGCVRQGMLLLPDDEKPAKKKKAAEPPPAPPPPPPKKKGFVSPINPNVTAETIKVQPRLKLQKSLTTEFAAVQASHEIYKLPTEFRGSKVSDFGKASFTKAFDDETVSMIHALKPELDSLADQIGIPRIRGFKTTVKSDRVAAMGDGVMDLNPNHFNNYAANVGGRTSASRIDELAARRDKIKDQAKPIQSRLREIQDELTTVERRSAKHFELWDEKESLLRKFNRIRREDEKLWQQIKRAEAASGELKISTWKPGDDLKARPYTIDRYLGDQIDKARATLFHEFGHHVHHYLKKEGHRRRVGNPPLERALESYFRRAMADGGRDRAFSTYSTKNSHEWFAENFAAYVLGKRNLVDPVAKELIERIFNGEYQ